MIFRFKRLGPNAMKGRGIGTARGRATIMRANGMSLASVLRNASFMNLYYSPPWTWSARCPWHSTLIASLGGRECGVRFRSGRVDEICKSTVQVCAPTLLALAPTPNVLMSAVFRRSALFRGVIDGCFFLFARGCQRQDV